MSMLPKDSYCKSSMLEGYVEINGDSVFIESIKKEVSNYIYIGKDLYEAQALMKDFLIHKYGEKWYLESGEAVNYIIENEYSTHFYNSEECKTLNGKPKDWRENEIMDKELLLFYISVLVYVVLSSVIVLFVDYV